MAIEAPPTRMLVYNRPLDDGPHPDAGATFDMAGMTPFLLGRTALGWAARAAGADRAVLPAFVCPLVVDVFLRRGCRVTFYDHLGPDLVGQEGPVLDALARAGAGAALVWVDHWGLGRGISTAVLAACRQQGSLTIVDAVHALPGAPYAGDFVVYGARKLLHVPLGALLATRASDGAAPPATVPGLSKALGLAYHLRTALLRRHGRPAAAAWDRLAELLPGMPLNLDKQDLLVRSDAGHPALLGQLRRRDLAGIGRRRAANFHRLAAALAPHLLETVPACPLGLPLVVQPRDELRRWLWDHEIFTSTLWDQLHGLVYRGGNGQAVALSRQILTLPVNHDLGDEQLDHVIQQVRAFAAV